MDIYDHYMNFPCNMLFVQMQRSRAAMLRGGGCWNIGNVNFSPKLVFSVEHSPPHVLPYWPINYSQVMCSSFNHTSFILGQPPFSSILSTLALWRLIHFSSGRYSLTAVISLLATEHTTSQQKNCPPTLPVHYFSVLVSMSLRVVYFVVLYDVWLFAPTYACISTKLKFVLC